MIGSLPEAWRQRLTALRRSDSLAARFVRGSLSSILVNVLGAGISFLTQILIARSLGEAAYGGYAYFLSGMNWVALVARFQIDLTSTRYVARYVATGAHDMLRGFLRWSHLVVLGLSLLAAPAFYLVMANAEPHTPEEMAALVAASVLLVPHALVQLSSAATMGFQRMIASQAATLVLRPLVFGLLVVSLVLAGRTVGAAGALYANAVATTLALGVTWYYLGSNVRRIAGPSGAVATEVRTWLGAATGFWLLTMTQQLLSAQTDVLIVGSLRTKTEAGIYSAAAQLALLVQFGVHAVSMMGAPVIAQLYAQERRAELARLMKHYGRMNLLVAVPVFGGCVVLGPFLLGLFGDGFRAAYPILLILGITQVISAGVGAQAGYLLTMTGREREAGVAAGVSAAVSLALSLYLTTEIGMIGTAVATLIGAALRAILMVRTCRRELGISPLPF